MRWSCMLIDLSVCSTFIGKHGNIFLSVVILGAIAKARICPVQRTKLVLLKTASLSSKGTEIRTSSVHTKDNLKTSSVEGRTKDLYPLLMKPASSLLFVLFVSSSLFDLVPYCNKARTSPGIVRSNSSWHLSGNRFIVLCRSSQSIHENYCIRLFHGIKPIISCRRVVIVLCHTVIAQNFVHDLISYISYFLQSVRNLVSYENHTRIQVYLTPPLLYENL